MLKNLTKTFLKIILELNRWELWLLKFDEKTRPNKKLIKKRINKYEKQKRH